MEWNKSGLQVHIRNTKYLCVEETLKNLHLHSINKKGNLIYT